MKTANLIIRVLFDILAVVALLFGKFDYMIFSMLFVIYMELQTIENKLLDK